MSGLRRLCIRQRCCQLRSVRPRGRLSALPMRQRLAMALPSDDLAETSSISISSRSLSAAMSGALSALRADRRCSCRGCIRDPVDLSNSSDLRQRPARARRLDHLDEIAPSTGQTKGKLQESEIALAPPLRQATLNLQANAVSSSRSDRSFDVLLRHPRPVEAGHQKAELLAREPDWPSRIGSG